MLSQHVRRFRKNLVQSKMCFSMVTFHSFAFPFDCIIDIFASTIRKLISPLLVLSVVVVIPLSLLLAASYMFLSSCVEIAAFLNAALHLEGDDVVTNHTLKATTLSSRVFFA